MKNYCGKKIFANCIRGFEAVDGKLQFDETGMTFTHIALTYKKETHELNIMTL